MIQMRANFSKLLTKKKSSKTKRTNKKDVYAQPKKPKPSKSKK